VTGQVIVFAYHKANGAAAIASVAKTADGPAIAGEVQAPTLREAFIAYGEMYGDMIDAAIGGRPQG
jgi:hypothetical protein